jgi:hypothetical protein
MEVKKAPRKRRQDTKHAVYTITNNVTGQQYIGITVCGQQVRKALKFVFKSTYAELLLSKKCGLYATVSVNMAQNPILTD